MWLLAVVWCGAIPLFSISLWPLGACLFFFLSAVCRRCAGGVVCAPWFRYVFRYVYFVVLAFLSLSLSLSASLTPLLSI